MCQRIHVSEAFLMVNIKDLFLVAHTIAKPPQLF